MQFLVDDIGKVVESMRALDDDGNPTGPPYYIYGHKAEINLRLIKQDGDPILKKEKYPLIALRMDIPEENDNGIIRYKLNLAIVEYTSKTDYVIDRYAKVIKPVLYPLYESFLVKLKQSGLFFWDGNQRMPKHTKIDRPYWGTPNDKGNTENIFSDPLDCIEIINLEVNQNYKC